MPMYEPSTVLHASITVIIARSALSMSRPPSSTPRHCRSPAPLQCIHMYPILSRRVVGVSQRSNLSIYLTV
ncbi:hypothetical protein BDR04DRAFT_1110740 [Suillus decipiens]|nr:hypothetical protein BDR04DRAFT_1110740 [Suillus decipiens]